MNDLILKKLKTVVEQAVRPIRATLARKRKMREELLAHLATRFEEEVGRVGDEEAALAEVKRRFGDPTALTSELQESVSRWDRVRCFLEKYSFQPGGSVLHLAATSMLYMGLMVACMLLAAVVISMVRATPVGFGMFVHVSLVAGVAVATFMFLLLFLAERIGRALYGNEANRSWSKAVFYCLASLAVFPAFAFLTYLAGTFDLAASLAHLRFACCFAPAAPLVFVAMARLMMEEINYREQWASLDIED